MAGLARYLQKLFGINAGANQMAEYGSFLSTPQLYDGATITPAIIQALSNFQQGLYGAVGGAYSPTIQDQNSLFFLAFYQLSYLLTRGIPEWDSTTTYNTNDFCKVGNVLYYSLIDSNSNNNPISSPTHWKSNTLIIPTQQIIRSGSGTYTPTNPNVLYLRVRMCGGGGGGQGSGNTSPGGDGVDGGPSNFGTFIVANGGKGATTSPGAGGGYSINAGAYGLGLDGQDGSFGTEFGTVSVAGSGNNYMLPGGNGGNSLFAGGGAGSGIATVNTGGGGAGGNISASIFSGSLTSFSGNGGGGGGYVDVLIPNPVPTSFVVGGSGTGGTAGSSGNTGGNGSLGIIIIDEFYQ